MTEPDDHSDEQTDFPGGWRGLYIFIILWGILQIVLLYLFTRVYN